MLKPSVKNVWASSPTSNVIKPSDSKILDGWVAEIPPHEWFNWEMNRQGSFSSYVNSIGVPEWDNTTQYFANRSLTSIAGTVYKCVQDNTNKNPETETAYWVLFGFNQWKSVDSGYQTKAGEKIVVNNRTSNVTVSLPSGVNYGDEVIIHPYPFTSYSKRTLTVNSALPIMGLSESMVVAEDNVVFSCKYFGSLFGWIVEKMGYSGRPARISTYSGASYGAGPERQYDATIVDGAPLVMMVHGGGWTAGSRTNANFEGGQYVSQFPSKYGISFASIDYTLATPTVESYPTAVNDIIQAAEHMKATYGVNKIHLLGSSAGANLAALAVIERPDLFASFIGYYGVYDLTKTGEIDPSLYDDIAQYTSDPVAASPIFSASEFTIPAYLLHGDADTTINKQQTIDFAAALGVTPDILAGEPHSFKVFGDYNLANMPDFAKRVFSFMDKVGE